MILITIILILWCTIVLFKTKSTDEPVGFTTANTLPLRGILALLITIHHACLLLTFGIPSDSPVYYLNELHEWGYLIVSVFFFISGYGLIKSYNKKKETYLNDFVSKRITKILIPFIFCVGIYLLTNYFLFHSTVNCDLDAWRVNCPLLPTSWYVVVILLFYLAFYIIARLLRQIPIIILGVLVFTFLYVAVMRSLNFREYWWCTTPCICLGMITAHMESVFQSFLRKRFVITILTLLSLWCCLLWIYPSYQLNEHQTCPILGMLRGGFIVMFVYVYISLDSTRISF